jgi:tRNA (guanine-N7-)-methyltransferase
MQTTERFYGRLKTRALAERQKELMMTLLPELRYRDESIDRHLAEAQSIHEQFEGATMAKNHNLTNTDNKPNNDSSYSTPSKLFEYEGFCKMSINYKKVFLEIGFGTGEHLAQLASQNPEYLYIGSEPFVNGVASLLCKISDNNIKNIRIFDDDARKLLPHIKDSSIDAVFLMFPDPWPKRKHLERRFVNKTNIERVHRILKDDAVWRIATDHPTYASHVLTTFSQFENLFKKIGEYSRETRPSKIEWPETKYENKSKSENILYVEYQKIIPDIVY